MFRYIDTENVDVLIEYRDTPEETVKNIIESIKEESTVYCFSYGGILLQKALKSSCEHRVLKVYYYGALVFDKVEIDSFNRKVEYTKEKEILKDYLSAEECSNDMKSDIVLKQFEKSDGIYRHHMNNDIFKKYLKMATEYKEPLEFSFDVKIYSSRKISSQSAWEKIDPYKHLMMIEMPEVIIAELESES